MKNILIMFLFLMSFKSINAKEQRIKKFEWSGIEVTWIEDERFPTYDMDFYFADGALKDGPKEKGLTSATFELIASGTRRFSQEDIADNLEFFGVSYRSQVTHEYSTLSINGLVKDIVPTVQKFCHLFQDAVYPQKELDKTKKRIKNLYQNLVNDHGSLSSRAFREISLGGTSYESPAEGKLNDFLRIKRKDLKDRLDYFNKSVKKRIYITGPKKVLDIQSIIKRDCNWDGTGQFVRSESYKPVGNENGPEIFLVTVPKANQAQVRIGRFLNKDEFDNNEIESLVSEYLGGGFTSKLMRELRVKRGLTYSVNAFSSGQKDYGRAGISTFTKSETVSDLLSVTKEVLDKLSVGDYPIEELERAKGNLAGGYPFRFEKSSVYLSQLLFLDHIGKPYSYLYDFPEKVRQASKDQVTKALKDIFSWNKQTIVILGEKSLAKELQKFGKVKVVNYKSYL